MIWISEALQIHETEIVEEFVRAGGPGGQHVNKSSSAVQLRFDIPASGLPEPVKARLRQLAGQRVNSDGVLILLESRSRSQHQNREAARQQLAELVRAALRAPKRRRATRPSRAARQKRLEAKRRHSEKKQLRRDGNLNP